MQNYDLGYNKEFLSFQKSETVSHFFDMEPLF